MENSENYKFFQHLKCEFFPCHKGLKPEEFNCLFCYCPLYALGRNCGGSFKYTAQGIKDCSDCVLPHKKGNYEYVTKKASMLIDLVKEEA